PPDLCPAHTEVFQWMGKRECHFINGTEKVRYVERHIYNRELYVMFDSDVGHFVGFTPYGEIQAWCCNRDPVIMERRRAEADSYCRHYYELFAQPLMER
ncbi:HB2L protein, partial [Vireo altiloquus]|nr:HB2L protein [Vireo altiloquus]